MLRNSFWMLLGVVGMGGLNYLFKVIMGNVLSPVEFGLLTTVTALPLLYRPVSGIIDNSVTKIMSHSEEQIFSVMVISVGVSIILAFAILIASPFISNMVDVPAVYLYILVIALVGDMVKSDSVLESRGMFKELVAIRTSTKLVIVLASLSSYWLTNSLLYAVFFLFFGSLLESLIYFIPARKHVDLSWNYEGGIGIESVSSLFRVIAMIFLPLTILVMSSLGSRTNVANFGILVLFAKPFIMVSTGVSDVLLPESSRGDSQVKKALSIAIVPMLGGLVLASSNPNFWISTFFPKYAELSGLLILSCLGGLFSGINYIFLTDLVGRNQVVASAFATVPFLTVPFLPLIYGLESMLMAWTIIMFIFTGILLAYFRKPKNV